MYYNLRFTNYIRYNGCNLKDEVYHIFLGLGRSTVEGLDHLQVIDYYRICTQERSWLDKSPSILAIDPISLFIILKNNVAFNVFY